jgi:fluoroacetyl-CoA thioesterase
MKDTLKPGLELTRRITVDRDRTIDFMGEDGRVYGTPHMVRDIEETCRELMLAHADAGEDSVGVHVDVSHSAPTLLGMWVELTVKVTEVDGRRVVFQVSGRDAVDEICRGVHQRVAVDTAKTLARLKAKAAKAQAATTQAATDLAATA